LNRLAGAASHWEFSMYQSKWGYYTDFVVYPVAVIVLACMAFASPHSRFLTVFLLCCLSGLATWTFIEYVMHRFVFHAVPKIAQMHDRHHADPVALVGTPSWLSLVVFISVGFFPLWATADVEVASGVAAGLMMGFTWYIAVHHLIHRLPLKRGSVLYEAKLRHAGHHAGHDGNFGVTTGFWDRALGTVIARNEVR
jgi:sterol desaturase/sphingolipid hydroxylase (fatty acid hydroxylase superfamily)